MCFNQYMDLLLFDIDGTLCKSALKIETDIGQQLERLSKKYSLGLVGGGKFNKLEDQMDSYLDIFDYVFTENGNTLIINKELVYKRSMREHFGSHEIKKINEFLLKYLSEYDLPIKTGNFIDMRDGLIYFTPIGQSCTREERKEFKILDEVLKIRLNMIKDFEDNFANSGYDLEFSLGGEIGISIYPKGWDKSYCLDYLQNKISPDVKVYYFGDKIFEYGNDYPIATHPRMTNYYSVTCPDDTLKILKDL